MTAIHKDNCHFAVLLKDSNCLAEEEGRLCSCDGWEEFKNNKLVKAKRKMEISKRFLGVIGKTLFTILFVGLIVLFFGFVIKAVNKDQKRLIACNKACEYRYVKVGRMYPILTCICLNDKGLEFEKEAQKELNQIIGESK